VSNINDFVENDINNVNTDINNLSILPIINDMLGNETTDCNFMNSSNFSDLLNTGNNLFILYKL